MITNAKRKRTHLHDGHKSYVCVSHGSGYVAWAKNGSLSPQPKLLRTGGLGVRRCHDTVIDLFSDYAKCDTHHDDVLSIEYLYGNHCFPLAIDAYNFLPCATTSSRGLSFRRRKKSKDAATKVAV